MSMSNETIAGADLPELVQVGIEDAIQMAQRLASMKLMTEAGDVLEAVVDADPDNATALSYLGITRFDSHGPEYSAELFERAAALDPQNASFANNLGNAFFEMKQLDDAARHYERAIAMKPDLGEPYANLAIILRHRGDRVRAEALLREAVELSPTNYYALNNLGMMLVEDERLEEAMVFLGLAMRHAAGRKAAAPLLAIAFWVAGRKDEALELVKEWLAQQPDDPQARHIHAAFTGENIPARASDAYVENLFDMFASSFDAKLDGLDYRAPQLAAGALAGAAAHRADKLRIIDAGCGTGKCGPFLKPLAAELVGVDLSKGMIARARKLRIYDALVQAELTGFLESTEPGWDAIVSADTLCYFGPLEAFASAASRALGRNGILVFTVEALIDTSAPYRLSYNGRYQHARQYLQDVLAAAGFGIVDCVDEVLRKELGKPVNGYLVTATRN